ncbi:mitochondrial fission regulator 2 isoform X2 [Amia ocellicauda]|uniref:mitochondrial fission regulator 2 isoform X2 n=1 Tax=Amia ocellicauda TaxID=2972642 RepID=UPI003463D6C0
MSLFVDVLDLLRYLLDYFGVSPDMLVPVWDSQLCGQYRSIIRMIGTNLPLSPCPRVHFQITLRGRHGSVDYPDEGPVVPSFADVMWIANDEEETLSRFRNEIHPVKGRQTVQFLPAFPMQTSMLPQPVKKVFQKKPQRPPDAEAFNKITALEDELLRLRAQIAMIVTTQSGSARSQCELPGTPGMSPLLPALTSTPVSVSRCAPPPPAPPLPSSPKCRAADISAFDLIRQRRATNVTKRSGREKDSSLKSSSLPSMLDVLKDLNKVQLRSTERSPGGTPVMKKDKKRVCLSDPASLIAEALKRKFAHRHKEDSFDKENRSFETSPFGSPEVPRIALRTLACPGKITPVRSDHVSPALTGRAALA